VTVPLIGPPPELVTTAHKLPGCPNAEGVPVDSITTLDESGVMISVNTAEALGRSFVLPL
jgi:hypothetical protein